MTLFSLKNKIALVTGGYGHLGISMVNALVASGAKVFVCARNKNKFHEVFKSTQDNIHFEEMDISSTLSINKCVSRIYKKEQKIDILINNAIYLESNDPEQLSDEEWNVGVDGTLNSVYRCIREIIPYFKKQKNGAIINISSMYGIVSPDFNVYSDSPEYLNPPHYGAAKAGVIQLTKYFAVYLAKHNIRVNAISPGAFPSENVQKNAKFIKNLIAKIPLGRIGKPDDLMGTIVFLASDASKFIIGQNIIVDGGWTIK